MTDPIRHLRQSAWIPTVGREPLTARLATAEEAEDQVAGHRHDLRLDDKGDLWVDPLGEIKTWPETPAEARAFTAWQHEVSSGDTLQGFRQWIAAGWGEATLAYEEQEETDG